MRTAWFLVALGVTACSGDEAPDSAVDAGPACKIGPTVDCVPGGLAGLTFDANTPWHLVGTVTETSIGLPTTTAVDRMVTFTRSGTGCAQFKFGTGQEPSGFVDDTQAYYQADPMGPRYPYILYSLCRSASDGALHYTYKQDVVRYNMNQSHTEIGVLTPP